MKNKKPSFLQAKKLLTNNEYEQYKTQQQYLAKEKLKQNISNQSKNVRAIHYSKSTSGKVGNAIAKGFNIVRKPHGITNALYRNKPISSTISSGKRGRPTGSVDKRYASYGGVYEYRKAMAQERFKQRQMILQARNVSPAQQNIINQIRAREAYNQSNEEGRIIPNTYGKVNLGGIFDEIDVATHLVD